MFLNKNIWIYLAVSDIICIKTLPSDTIAYAAVTENLWRNDFTAIEAEKWLCRKIPSEFVFECTHIHRGSGMGMTILKW